MLLKPLIFKVNPRKAQKLATHKYTPADESSVSLIKKSKNSMKPLGSNDVLYELLKDETYSPHEDYLQFKDGSIATVLTLDFDYGRVDPLPLQWGVELLDKARTLTREYGLRFVQITTLDPVDEEWLKKADKATKAIASAEGEISDKAAARLKDTDASKKVRKRGLRNAQIADIKQELDNDGQYFSANFKFLMFAKDLETFDEFFRAFKHKLRSDFLGFKVVTHLEGGENVFKTLFIKPLDDLGRPPMFTNTEFAGYYNFLSQGISDTHGMYVGEQVGDVNNMSVLMDMAKGLYDNDDGGYAVIVGNKLVDTIDRGSKPENQKQPVLETDTVPGMALWSNTVATQYIMRAPKNRVVTLSFAPIELSRSLQQLSNTYDMSQPLINPIEQFRIREKVADVNAINNEKWESLLREMASSSQAKASQDVRDTVISELTAALDTLYTNAGMRGKNLTNDNRTRLVGIYHEEVPTLLDFATTLTSRYNAVSGQRSSRQDILKATTVQELMTQVASLLSQHGDLFNTKTSVAMDTIGQARHDLFDFSGLKKRSMIAMMLQLINSLDLIMSTLKRNDLLVLYGCDNLENFGLDYLIRRLREQLHDKGVRLVCLYDTVSAMKGQYAGGDFTKSLVTDPRLDLLNNAHYVMLGRLSQQTSIDVYNELVAKNYQITEQLQNALTSKNSVQHNLSSTVNTRYYFRRGYENIVFDANPILN